MALALTRTETETETTQADAPAAPGGGCHTMERDRARRRIHRYGRNYMAQWQQVMDEIAAIVRDAEEEELSIDRRIQIAQAHAILAVAQLLSSQNG